MSLPLRPHEQVVEAVVNALGANAFLSAVGVKIHTEVPESGILRENRIYIIRDGPTFFTHTFGGPDLYEMEVRAVYFTKPTFSYTYTVEEEDEDGTIVDVSYLMRGEELLSEVFLNMQNSLASLTFTDLNVTGYHIDDAVQRNSLELGQDAFTAEVMIKTTFEEIT